MAITTLGVGWGGLTGKRGCKSEVQHFCFTTVFDGVISKSVSISYKEKIIDINMHTKYDDGKDCLCSALSINCLQFGCFLHQRYVSSVYCIVCLCSVLKKQLLVSYTHYLSLTMFFLQVHVATVIAKTTIG